MNKKGFEIRCNNCGCNRVNFSQYRRFGDYEPETTIVCEGCGNKETRWNFPFDKDE